MTSASPDLIPKACNFDHGTQVEVEGIFHDSKIRRYDLTVNARAYHQHTVALVNHYSIVYPHIEFRLICEFTDGKAPKTHLKPAFSDQKSNLEYILGKKLADTLVPFRKEVDGAVFEGFLMDMFHEAAHSDANQAFMSVNNRPVGTVAGVTKILKHKIDEFTLRKKYFLILNIQIPYSQVDVSFEKSKMSIKFLEETRILDELRSLLEEMLDDFYGKIKQADNGSKKTPKIEFNSGRISEPRPAPQDAPTLKPKGSFASPKERKEFDQKVKKLEDELTQNIHRIIQDRPKVPEDLAPEDPVPSEAGHPDPAPQAEPSTFPISKLPSQMQGILVDFPKEKFRELSVIGQFNKGFIVCQMPQSDGTREFYVVDQHASDEKATFEGLIDSLFLGSQRLTLPLKIRLSFFDMHTVDRNLDVFNKLRFGLVLDAETNTAEIQSVPQFKGLTFGEKEFLEVVTALKEGEKMEAFLFSKLRSELASNACRKSIMIGQKLDNGRMTEVVQHLATLKSPFNCPHGRPTLFKLGFTEAPSTAAQGLDAFLLAD